MQFGLSGLLKKAIKQKQKLEYPQKYLGNEYNYILMFMSYVQVGQRHGGIMGLIQIACSFAQEHIWFERKIASDRRMVAERYVGRALDRVYV